MVGPNGIVDVGGAFRPASTLDVDNDDFLRGGDVHAQGQTATRASRTSGPSRPPAGTSSWWDARSRDHGVLGAFEGTVGLAGGNQVMIKAKGAGNERIFVSAGEGRVVNTGEIPAPWPN